MLHVLGVIAAFNRFLVFKHLPENLFEGSEREALSQKNVVINRDVTGLAVRGSESDTDRDIFLLGGAVR